MISQFLKSLDFNSEMEKELQITKTEIEKSNKNTKIIEIENQINLINITTTTY